MEKEKEIKKVTMEFEDGEIRSLEGEKAKQWLDSITQACVISYVHGEDIPKIEWDIVKEAVKK